MANLAYGATFLPKTYGNYDAPILKTTIADKQTDTVRLVLYQKEYDKYNLISI